MKYTEEFNSIDGRSYRIDIVTPSSGTDKKVKLSGTPFVSSVKGDDKQLYSPIRCGGATVGILSENYIFDFYSGQAKGVSVKLIEETDGREIVRWTGYVSPTIYDQGYDDYFESIDLDCVDGIAVLKDIPFRIGEREIVTFLEIIKYCLEESGCYKAFYISDNVQLTKDGTESVIEKFRVSTSNFFNQKKDINQTDDDVAWSCYEVLYHLLQWLGYTLTVYGDEVFILDYDAITAGINTYYRYSLIDGSRTYVSLSKEKNITGEDYSANGTKVCLDEIYNKVTVKDEFNTYDNLFPTFGDENFETNLTAPVSDLSKNFHDMTISSYGMGFGDHIAADKSVGVYENFIATISTDWTRDNQYLNFLKIMESPVFLMHKYDRNTRKDITDDPRFSEGNFSYNDLFSYNGAFYFRWKSFDSREVYDEWDHASLWANEQKRGGYKFNDSTAVKIKKWENLFDKIKSVSQISMQPVIMLLNDGDNRFGPGDEVNYNNPTENDVTKKYPFVTLKDTSSSAIFGGTGHFLRIKGKLCYHDEPLTPFPLKTNYNKRLTKHGDLKSSGEGYIWCKVKWGEKWWDGDGWSDQDCWFKLHYWNNKVYSDWPNNEETFSKEYEFLSNNYSVMFFGEDGYVIPCPPEENLNGTAEVSFTTRDMWGSSKKDAWRPSGSKFDNRYCRYLSKCVFISDLSITAEVSPGLLSDADLDSDTVYTNVIENGSVSPMSEISFKVCTDDGKKPSYSSVDLLEGSRSIFVTTTYNKALYRKELDTIGCDGLSGCLRQEEHYIFKTASHYESPKVIFECNLHDEDFYPYSILSNPSLGNRKFIISEYEINYRFNSCWLKISEKE